MSHKNDEVRLMIEQLKNDGLTFQEISDFLKAEKGITMSRQAVHAMYKRIVEKQKMFNSQEVVMIVAYRYFGKTDKEICDIIGIEASKASSISDVVKKNGELLISTSEITAILIDLFLDHKVEMQDLLKSIKSSFGIDITEDDIIAMIYNAGADKLIKKLKGEFNALYMSIGSIKEAERAFKKMCIDISKLGFKSN